ncbi:hypothetical protein [Paracandidimonas lactea]|uniref:hypothetical protein n=1 Tax=Paracandidimonas lactea TaxID=2895524 RepID=UPI001F44F5B7|nr:hypothetical protein [Paracandidimonas lactea]
MNEDYLLAGIWAGALLALAVFAIVGFVDNRKDQFSSPNGDQNLFRTQQGDTRAKVHHQHQPTGERRL